MRRYLIFATVVCVLGIATLQVTMHAQGPAERPNGQAENCFGHNMLEPPIAARMALQGDITKPGPHVATLQELTPIVIYPSRSWGGGKVTIPAGWAKASFTIQALPDNTRPVTANGRPVATPDLFSFKVVSVSGSIKSFDFPKKVTTGDNSFTIITDKSYVQVHGSSGVVPIDGEAQAWLTNRVFSKARPARVRVSFWGTYDFEKKLAIFSRFEAHAHSRG